MTDLNELEGLFEVNDTADHRVVVVEREPRKCRHPRDRRVRVHRVLDDPRELFHVEQEHPYDTTGRCTPAQWCGSCSKLLDPDRARRGKNARKRGLNLQLQAARDLGLTNLQGNGAADARTETMYGNAAFVAQMKSGGLFPGWMVRELDYLPRGQGRTPILVVIETPGPGRKARRLVVMDANDFRDLHVGEGEVR